MAPRFQFSIRLMLVATALIAVGAWVFTWEPSAPALIAMPAIVTSLVTLSAFACCSTTGKAKVFWFGFTIPVAIGILAATSEAQASLYAWHQRAFENMLPLQCVVVRDTLLGCLAFAPINGVVCALVHWAIWTRADGPVIQN